MHRRMFLKGLAAAPAAAAQLPLDWSAGAARVKSTPAAPIWMAGYDARNRPSEGVLNDLWVRALALRPEGGETSVIVTLEIAGVPRSLAAEVARRAARIGISRDRLLINSSHTHSGPMTGAEWIDRSPKLSEEQREVCRKYTAWLTDRIEEAIAQAARNLAPARLSYGQSLAGFAVNRRRVGALHRPGPVDHDVPVLAVHGADDRLLAVLFGYACHATVLDAYQINGDYPGFTQSVLEAEHPGAAALFLQGCGADANPLPRRSVDLARTYGKVLAVAVDEVLRGKRRPLRGPLRTAFDTVDLRLTTPPTRAQLDEQRKTGDAPHQRHAGLLLEVLQREGRIPDTYPYQAQVWQFGPGFTLIALSGEVVVDYSLRFKAAYGWGNTWVAGYSNDVFGYVPSLRVLREGGYEGGDAMLYRPISGPFHESVEESLAAKVDELVKRVRK